MTSREKLAAGKAAYEMGDYRSAQRHISSASMDLVGGLFEGIGNSIRWRREAKERAAEEARREQERREAAERAAARRAKRNKVCLVVLLIAVVCAGGYFAVNKVVLSPRSERQSRTVVETAAENAAPLESPVVEVETSGAKTPVEKESVLKKIAAFFSGVGGAVKPFFVIVTGNVKAFFVFVFGAAGELFAKASGFFKK